MNRRMAAMAVATVALWAQRAPQPPAKTGPAVGAPIPAFRAVDQDGKPQSFDTLRGPKGLVLMFVRSADW